MPNMSLYVVLGVRCAKSVRDPARGHTICGFRECDLRIRYRYPFRNPDTCRIGFRMADESDGESYTGGFFSEEEEGREASESK
eukprot:1007137-Amorphochlora_amoeboformis.AAC.1